jgi:hypothetical protein
VDDNVEPSKHLHRVIDTSFRGGAVRHVRNNEAASTACRLKLLESFFCQFVIRPAIYSDVTTSGRKVQRDCGADA